MKFSTALRVLVFAFPIFIVSFGVLCGGAMLASGLGDQYAAGLLAAVAIGFGMAGIVNMILLVAMMGLKLTMDMERHERRQGFRQQMRRRMGQRQKDCEDVERRQAE